MCSFPWASRPLPPLPEHPQPAWPGLPATTQNTSNQTGCEPAPLTCQPQHPRGAEARLPLPVGSESPVGEAAKSSVHKTKSGCQRPGPQGEIRDQSSRGIISVFPQSPGPCSPRGKQGPWSPGVERKVPGRSLSQKEGPLASHPPATLCNCARQDRSHDWVQAGARPAVGGHQFSAPLTAAGQARTSRLLSQPCPSARPCHREGPQPIVDVGRAQPLPPPHRSPGACGRLSPASCVPTRPSWPLTPRQRAGPTPTPPRTLAGASGAVTPGETFPLPFGLPVL